MKLKMYRFVSIVVLLLITIGLNSCGVYSFTGTSISPDIKTISIQTFINNSGGGPPTLSQSFTEKLREYYQRNTNLGIVNNEGDLQLDGTIIGYNLSPIAPQGGESQQAALNRLTITIKVSYINTKDETQNFDQSFSHYDDFPQSQSLSQVENRLIETISDRIILDIFNKSVANW